jgi:Tol biopolymer transport system component
VVLRTLWLPLLIAVLAVACGDDASGPNNAGGGGNGGPGALIYTQIDGIVEFDLSRRDLKPIITAEVANTFLLDPAASPDGDRIAYVVQPPPKIDGDTYDAGSDLWVANRDGTEAHVVFEHAEPNQLVRYPEWVDETSILAIVQEIVTEDGITRVVYTLQRIDIEGGARETVLEDVLSYDLSPDGEEIVYAHYAGEAGQTLDAVQTDGSNGRRLVGAEAALSPFQSPRYAPDGQTIAFASADQTGALAPVDLVRVEAQAAAARAPDGRAARVSRCCEPWPVSIHSKLMNGVPQDIWTVERSGGEPVRVADLKEDLPTLAWNGDGTRLYVLGLYGLYDVDLSTGIIERLGDGTFHGQVVWVP